jgi:CheY-like chemotaxis protein
LFEEPRELLQLVVSDFREMYPNRCENYCCTGGGGAMSMSEYSARRLKSAQIKADQLKATGAKYVVTSCHNCVDGLTDLIKHYKLDMKVTQLVNLVAEALIEERRGVPEPEVPVEVKPEFALTGKKILVTDDEPDFLTFLTAVLEDNGATVIKASSGDEAIKLALEEKPDLITLDLSMPGKSGIPDLITLDLSMPGKSGIETFEDLRKNEDTSSIPVCIITGKPEMRKLIYERPVAPEGYVDKPVDEEGILVNVRKTLEVVHHK